MSASNEIAGILEQWLQLTRAEGAAIQSANWSVIGQIQARKAALRKSLQETGGSPGSAPGPLRAKAARIISLLARNSEALAAQMRQARARQKLLNEAKRNLQRIQRSYVRPQPHAAWYSYS